MLPKTIVYVKRYDGQTRRMHFLIEDKNLWQKYNGILDKVSADIEKELGSNSVCK